MSERIQITTSELVEALRNEFGADAPPDAMTTAELAAQLGVHQRTVEVRLRRLRSEGRLQSWHVYRTDSAGRQQRVPAYAIIPTKKARR